MTPSEVAAVVQEVLGADEITADDNFFEVGGNSMLALTLISLIKARCGAALPLIEVIRDPTPAGMARFITRSAAGLTGAGLTGAGLTTVGGEPLLWRRSGTPSPNRLSALQARAR